ncbi:MAG: tRNA preQ1(34) S-adenosylmethionine ribosyltransferase-isomerase QueA [Treponema sp.]|jgi:S-adenosylmethionine:tRNA ribosyltransferase-isomerase|nr:tRNA preQ1(34) S-adenosylmethionine ribosyltransferase-isomerase QueA [Treponema sp.]
MKRTDFSFDLPEGLIAQFPPEHRGSSRLMVLDRRTNSRTHHWVADVPELLEPGSLLVFNNSKVRKARIRGVSAATGAPVEFLLVTSLDDRTWKSLVQRARRRRSGSRYVFAGGTEGEITGEEGEFRIIRFDRPLGDEWLDVYGHIPLPPYIKREDVLADSERYQTVYAASIGSAAAPTAGLHFTHELLSQLELGGIETAFITLHVGLGTFLPVRTEHIEDHRMHEEAFSIDESTARRIEQAKAAGRKVIAVGTTSLRTLESAWDAGNLTPGKGTTAIFMYPGYTFKVVDSLVTNFHTPESTLLMLVSAFAGREFILDSYAEAIREGYRFFSYGDAMLIV